jgi:hypothetical protein
MSALTVDLINKRIDKEVCETTIDKLTDDSLLEEYKKLKSVKDEINKLKEILKKNKISSKTIDSIINEYIVNLIPPGTKGVVRGNMFNKIVEKNINDMKLDKELFEVCFEKQYELLLTDEKPDWYILEKSTKKVIIGMNQLDLWGGGQQFNRGSKYLIDNKYNTEKSKLLCVVCNKINLASDKNKVYKLFETGYKNNTLCYLKNLNNIIIKFFK